MLTNFLDGRQISSHEQNTQSASQRQGYQSLSSNLTTNSGNQVQQSAPQGTTMAIPSPPSATIHQHARVLSQGMAPTRGHQAQPRIPSIGVSAAPPAAGPATTSHLEQPPYLGTFAHSNSFGSGQQQAASFASGSGSRNRANTINQMDVIPPALARLTHLGPQDPAGSRSALTPVLNRDEAIREWERRQNAVQMGHGKRPSMAYPGNPQLDYLQEQAEMISYGGDWTRPAQIAHSGGYYDPQPQQQRMAYVQAGYGGMQPPPPVMVDQNDRRRSHAHRSALSGDFGMLDALNAASATHSAGSSTSATSVSPRNNSVIYGHQPHQESSSGGNHDPYVIGQHEYMRHQAAHSVGGGFSGSGPVSGSGSQQPYYATPGYMTHSAQATSHHRHLSDSTINASSPLTAGASSTHMPAYPPPAASGFDSYDPRGDVNLSMLYSSMPPPPHQQHQHQYQQPHQQQQRASYAENAGYEGGGDARYRDMNSQV